MKPTERGYPTRVASRDGTEIAYYSSGEGPPLLLAVANSRACAELVEDTAG